MNQDMRGGCEAGHCDNLQRGAGLGRGECDEGNGREGRGYKNIQITGEGVIETGSLRRLIRGLGLRSRGQCNGGGKGDNQVTDI